ncbi:alpha/beta hydrolase [Kiloniella laminariae]|uniref:alpha/beta hydrolase n=1 Tax=Kiloniella laminariae TaxID=454162 RepID=UPI000375B3AE|nr:alpha/beta hydrolase [Kiloniella laminariae]
MGWIMSAVTVYVGLMVVMYLLQPFLLYPGASPREEPEFYGVEGMEKVSLTMDDGISLTHWFKAPTRPGYPVVLAFHGNAGHTGDRLPKLKYLLEMGFGLLQVEYRGYAGHKGRPSETAFKADGLKAMSWLLEQGYSEQQIITYGESLGTGMAIWLAARFQVQAVILEAPYSSIAEVAQAKYWYLPAKWLLRDKWRSDLAIRDVRAPLFIFHGEKDELIPVELSRRLLSLAPGEKQSAFFQEGYHMDLYDHGAEKNVRNFLEKYVLGELGDSLPEAAK